MSGTTPETDWPTIKRLVSEALDLPDSQRAAFIERATASDPALRREVRSLVDAATSSEHLITRDADAWVGIRTIALDTLAGTRVSQYILERMIGQGATSVVYRATQRMPQRTVALKVLRSSLSMGLLPGRFGREAAALGRISHPNIARIYEAGIHPLPIGETLPFIAMELVDGVSIIEFARYRHLSIRPIIELMIKVVDGVHAVHQQAVLHRDLKPANVLVSAGGEPKVVDFGISRLLDADDAPAWPTATGLLLGTPGYMSPEQISGKRDDIDVRTDLWAIGAILYELLAGRLPIDIKGATLPEALHRIASSEPTPLGRVNTRCRGDLETVVMTALATDKQRRYPSALAFAEDLRHVLNYEPVRVRPPSTRYVVGRFVRRHRPLVAVSAIALALLMGAMVAVVFSLRSAQHQRDRAQSINALLQQILGSVDAATGDPSVRMSDVLRRAEQRLAATAAPADIRADVLSSLGSMYFALGEYSQAEKLFRQALQDRDPTDVPGTVGDRNRLATALRWLGQPDEAETIAAENAPAAQRLLGPGHVATLMAREIQAGVLHDRAQLDAAASAYRAVLDDTLRALGPEHDQTLRTLSNLANVLSQSGQYEEAEALNRRAMLGHQRNGTASTLEGLTVRHNLASVLMEAGRLEEARAQLVAVSDEASQVLGPDHHQTLAMLANLAECLQRLGASARAAEIKRSLFDRLVKSAGWGDARTLDACMAFATALLRNGDPAEAKRVMDDAMPRLPEWVEPMNRQRMRLTHAAALAGARDFAQAIPLYESALAELRTLLGHTHPQVLVATNNLGLCLVEAGDGARAVQVLSALLVEVAERQPVMEPIVRRNLGQAYLAAKDFSAAEAQLLGAWELSQSRQDAENSTKTARALVALYQEWGRIDSVATWQSRGAIPTSQPR